MLSSLDVAGRRRLSEVIVGHRRSSQVVVGRRRSSQVVAGVWRQRNTNLGNLSRIANHDFNLNHA